MSQKLPTYVLITPARNEEAFAKATAELIEKSDLRRQTGEFGRKRVEVQLQWSVVGRNLVAVCQALLG